jgi:uncharacterized protein YjiS (DUF1127 family)
MVDIIVVLFALVGLAAIINEILKSSGVYEMSIFKRYWNYMNTWREHRRVIKELYAMDDRQLTDMGISRADIERLIWLDEDKTMRKRGEKE